MSFHNGILNLTNWAGNVIMPTLGALFIALAVIQYARGYHQIYSMWAYGGLMCLMVSGASPNVREVHGSTLGE